MKKEDFTPDSIYEELLDYTINRNYPDDEMNEIGAQHVSIEDISGIEISSVKKSHGNFIIGGRASLDVHTDLGDGDSFSDEYPMTFTCEFDSDGKIVKQLSRKIDTSSFFAGADDLYGDLVGTTGSSQAQVFHDSLQDIQSHLHRTDTAAFLHKLLFVHVITALESYLSDFLISKILKDNVTLRRFIEEVPAFQDQKMSVSEVFKARATIKKRAIGYLENVVWHRLDHVGKMYSKVLGIDFPSDFGRINDAVKLRNLLVHRNGKTIDGKKQKVVSETHIVKAMGAVEALVKHIEDRWDKLESKQEPKLPEDVEI